ncbi:MAG TPA: potassium-transporting ATPase subunit KdpA, partial [Negativicutes bacterium]
MINDLLLFLVYLVGLMLLAMPLGKYMANVFQGKKTFLDPILVPFEKLIYKVCGIDAGQEMNWKQYSWA